MFTEIRQTDSSIATITIFEVIEHLSNDKLDEFLSRANKLFNGNNGVIFVSVPIEIGPVLLFKELHRFLVTKKFEYKFFEFLLAVIFGIPGKRIESNGGGYGSHKGFDFRKTLRYFEMKGWKTKIIGYGPLPFNCWYGNSQVFFVAGREKI
jgi:hypothetical protein